MANNSYLPFDNDNKIKYTIQRNVYAGNTQPHILHEA